MTRYLSRVLLGALLAVLQGAALPTELLPAQPLLEGPQESAYASAVAALAAEPVWTWERIEALRARDDGRRRTLAARVPDAGDAELRLLAVLGADCPADGALADAFLRRAVLGLPEAAGVACLLAPRAVTEAWWAALAHLAARPAAPLALRAAAIARLLDSGCDAAWPWARAVLLTGTAHDESPDPFADWRRSGRYELPKRLIAGALAARLDLGDAAGFEPNAAWAEQERAVARIGAALAVAARSPSTPPPANWQALLPAAAADPAARRALAMLGTARPALLRAALSARDPGLAATARRALDERPR